MIVPMKKVTLLCLDELRDDSLKELRDLGVVHLAHIQPPEGDDLEKAKTRLTYVQRALEVLPPHAHVKPSGKSGDEVIEAVWKLIHQKKDLKERLESLRHDEKQQALFGNFDPASVEQLRDGGIAFKLYKAGPRDELTPPEGAAIHIIHQDKENVCFALVGKGDVAMEGMREFRLPEQSLADLRRKLAETEAALEKNESELHGYAGDHAAVSQIVDDAEARVSYLEARAGMGATEQLAYLQGYCPTDATQALRKAAADHGWGLLIEEPADDDPVPTKITNPRWIEPIKAIFDLTGIIPGYEEVDISTPFLIFLSIFFAMLVGDAGYGILFVLLTRFARKKMPNAPKYPFLFMYIMSISTIVWGVMTGTYFGIDAWRKDAVIPWLSNDNNVMLLCFLIGAIQLSVAHVWNFIRTINRPQCIAQLGWVCMTWTMFFVAQIFVLSKDLPMKPILILGGVGAACIVLFMTPVKKLKSEWFGHAMLPLDIIGNFTDVVSYLRLFAVGTASFAVASAFNNMLAPMFGHVFSSLIGALLLFAGHALNIALCGLGILVHGVRLNTLEFSSHVGMQWTGHHYEPFTNKKKTIGK
jgi:V/A-type H+-transporting ATPase subunit I